MKFIDTIEIKNFKSIRHQKIEGCKRINVFIGYPNVGKSNVLEALSLFCIDNFNPVFSSFIRIEKLTTLFHNGEVTKQAEVRVNNKHRIVIRFKGNIALFEQQFEEEGTSFKKEDEQVITLDGSSDVTIKKSFHLNEGGKDKIITDYRGESIGKVNELSEIKKYEFVKGVNYTNIGYSGLNIPYGNNLFNIIEINEALLEQVRQLFKDSDLDFLYDSREQAYTILKRVDKGIFTLPYNLSADTLQRLIFYKAAILSNKENVLLFEEPEAHMFPPYVSKFTSDIWYNKENQYFITTHSSYVLNDFLENAKEQLAIYAVSYHNGETFIKKMTDQQVHEAYQYGVDLFLNIKSFTV